MISEVEQGPQGPLQLAMFQLVSLQKIWRTALRIFLIFCMNVPYYKTKKRTRPFFREKSGSLIIHENVFFWEENNFSKNNRIFFGQSVFGFGKNTLRTTTCEILGKILRAVLEICDRLQINIFVSKFKKIFSKSPNGSIRKVNWLESIF